MSARLAVLLWVAASGAALAQDGGEPVRPSEDALFGGGEARPSDDAIFGGEAEPEADGGVPQAPALVERPLGEQTSSAERDDRDELLMAPPAQDRFQSGEAVDDPLKIGGQFYLRYFGNAVENTQLKNVAFSSPNLLDVYLDARPNDRLRGFARFRMRFDPTFDPDASSPLSALTSASSAQQSLDSGSAVLSGGGARANPDFVLDQLWLNFDVLRTVFVTAGRQHVRWTASRFWQPTDFLSPQLRDPLAVFDQRVGASALKLHLPVEKLGWNFYAVTLLDNAGPANALGELGQALRGELVVGPAELGLTAVFQRGRGPRYGLDLSAGLGPFDVYGDLALHPRANRQLVRWREGEGSRRFEFVLSEQINSLGTAPVPYETYTPDGPIAQFTVGATYPFAYSDTDLAIFGLEYFNNGYGYDDRNLLPLQFATGTYTPFYAGRHYGGAYIVLMGPGSFDNGSFVFSTLGNLSDRSFVSRLDFSYRALSFLQLEAFAGYHYGQLGEFHYALDLPAQRRLVVPPLGLTPAQQRQLEQIRDRGIQMPAPTFDFGVGARINL